MGIVSAGTGIGGLVWAPALTGCIGRIGLRNTLRLSGCLATALICASGLVLCWKPTTGPPAAADKEGSRLRRVWQIPLPSWQIVKQRKFVAHALGAICQSAAYYTPVFFTVSYAKTLGWDETSGANLAALGNACNAIGKMGVGFVADRIGRLNAFFLTTFISALSIFAFWVASTLVSSDQEAARALYIAFTTMYGLFASAYVSLFSPAMMELFGLEDFPRVSGVMFMLQGAAALVGTPLAGLLVHNEAISRSPKEYLSMAICVGALFTGAAFAVGWVRVEIGRERDVRVHARI
jgi:hypothetical protein